MSIYDSMERGLKPLITLAAERHFRSKLPNYEDGFYVSGPCDFSLAREIASFIEEDLLEYDADRASVN
jgi:hypothetical protein